MSDLLLQSEGSSCVVLPERGGLISSLKLHDPESESARELLWMPEGFSAEESSWPGGGIPLLFPFAGRVWHHGQIYQYGLGADVFPMPIHGFAYASTWQVLATSKKTATLSLHPNAATTVLYPFAFEVRLTIDLSRNSVKLTCDVAHSASAPSNQLMPVALGWHPYFRLPNKSIETKVLVPARKYHTVTPVGAAGKIAASSELGATPWLIHKPLMNSLILTDLERPEAQLISGSQSIARLDFGPPDVFQHIVVWSNQICRCPMPLAPQVGVAG